MNETPFQNPRGGYFTMNDRGRLVGEKQHNPNNVHMGERYYSRQGPMGNPRLANYSTKDRVYDDYIIKDYLQQGIISPSEVQDIGKPGYKQVVPQLMGQQLASMDPGSKYNGTYKQEGYGDPRFDDFGQDEFYDFRDGYMDDVIDPGLSGYDRGPLYFS